MKFRGQQRFRGPGEERASVPRNPRNSLVLLLILSALGSGVFILVLFHVLTPDESRRERWASDAYREARSSRFNHRSRGTDFLNRRLSRVRLRRTLDVQKELHRFIGSNTTRLLDSLGNELLSSFDDNPVISIRGFYSSGTNWLRALILTNCPTLPFEHTVSVPYLRNVSVSLDADGLYGWKHGYFLGYEKERFIRNEKHSIVIISREAPTWVLSAMKMKAMMNRPKLGWMEWSLGLFRRRSNGQTNQAVRSVPTIPSEDRKSEEDLGSYLSPQSVNESSVYDWFANAYYHHTDRLNYNVISDSVLGARTLVYRNWMDLLNQPEISSRIHFMRYEDLYDETMEKFTNLMLKTRVPCKVPQGNEFDDVTGRVKFGKRNDNINVKARNHRFEFCTKVKEEETYRKILSQIDLTFEERVLGYNYPTTLHEYCLNAFY